MKTIVYPSKNKVYIVPNKIADAVMKIWDMLETDAGKDLSREELGQWYELKKEYNKIMESYKSYPIHKILDGDYI